MKVMTVCSYNCAETYKMDYSKNIYHLCSNVIIIIYHP